MAATVERDLNDVYVFTRVVEAGSFTGAARALGLPVSTVSRRVARLEEALGARLLTRTTRRLSLTDAGQLYYERGVRMLSELEEAESIISEGQRTPRGRVRVASPPEHHIVMRLTNTLLSRYPEIRVELDFTYRRVNILEEGYDVAFVAGSPDQLSVVAHKLMDSPFSIVASPDYIKRRGKPKRPADLAEHDCIVFGASTMNAQFVLANTKVAVRGRVAANHLHAVRDAAVAGHGIALLPTLACRRELKSKKLVALLPDAAPPSVPIYLCYAAGRFLPAAVRTFVDFAKEHFEAMGQDPRTFS